MDDPLDDTRPGARAFDDEGTPCAPLGLIEKGVLRNTYTDLFYAGKLRKSPTGHGYKTAMWGGDPVSLKPVPSLQHLSVRPGGAALDAMIGSMDRGIIAAQVLGAHSGNIINGDFSMGLSPGLYAEDGSIRGHVKDVMVSGNIYDTLGAVVLLEDTNHPCEDGRYPGILVDGVGVVIGGS
jgi:PmbA protein